MNKQTAIEPAVMAFWRDARMIGCAPRRELKPHLPALIEVRDEVTRAIEKAQQ